MVAFRNPLNLHYSQTGCPGLRWGPWFRNPLNLHYSQTLRGTTGCLTGFGIPWIYTTLKHVRIADNGFYRFGIPWIYTTLKPIVADSPSFSRFGIPWIYTTLKLTSFAALFFPVSESLEFTLLSNGLLQYLRHNEFRNPLNLHYSQTLFLTFNTPSGFGIPWIYTTLKLYTMFPNPWHCFGIPWIYTTLKLPGNWQ